MAKQPDDRNWNGGMHANRQKDERRIDKGIESERRAHLMNMALTYFKMSELI